MDFDTRIGNGVLARKFTGCTFRDRDWDWDQVKDCSLLGCTRAGWQGSRSFRLMFIQ